MSDPGEEMWDYDDWPVLDAPCPECGGDGGFETWGAFCSVAGDIMRGWAKCLFCGGTGGVETKPLGIEDLEPLVPK